MNILEMLLPAGVLGGMGVLFGAGLAFASKKLAVPVDERVEKVRECLPGAGCGACGYTGCDSYAAAVVNEGAPANCCPVGGEKAAQAIAAIMGVEAGQSTRMVATVLCQGDSGHCKTKYTYEGLMECRAMFLTSGGDKACKYACLGLGSCARVCEFGAITIHDRLVSVDPDKCKGCGKCIEVCPKSVLRLEPYGLLSILRCRAVEKGKAVRDACQKGCIGCGKCARNCKFGAITMENNLPVVDMEKCVSCLECVRNCPTGAMTGDLSKRKHAVIDQSRCVGCTLCDRQCKFEAITGALKEKHAIDPEKCVGCGQCVVQCPRKCITLE